MILTRLSVATVSERHAPPSHDCVGMTRKCYFTGYSKTTGYLFV